MSNTQQEPVSITAIIPRLNDERFVRQALASVACQTLLPSELIIIDDDSNDNGAAIVEEFGKICPVRSFRIGNTDGPSARNFAIAHAKHDLIALLDRDAAWYPSHLAKLVEPFRQKRSQSLGWVYSNVDEIDPGGKFISRSLLTTLKVSHPRTDISECLRNGMCVPISACLISRRAFEAVGGFDERLSDYASDDLFFRLLTAGYENVFIDLPLSGLQLSRLNALYSPNAAVCRMNYARKLLAIYSLDAHGRSRERNLIIWRFILEAAESMRAALRAGNTVLADICKSDIESLELLADPTEVPPLRRTTLLTTVVIPLHNGEGTIEAALRSVTDQTLPPDEIIVVNDGSTDGGALIVARIASRYPITLLSKPKGGPSSARNLGVRRAHGDLIALLDQHDAWYPSHLEELTKPFREPRLRPLGWVYSDLDEINWTGGLLTQCVLKTATASHPKTSVEDCLRRDMLVAASATLISRRALVAVGGFDEMLVHYEEDDLFLRLLQAGYDNVYVDKALVRRRMHPLTNATSERNAFSRMTYLRKLIAAFPDETHLNRHPVGDLVAPRFLRDAVSDARSALRTANHAWIEICFDNLRLIEGLLTNKQALEFDQREPLISAVIALNNGGAFIERAVRSVIAQTREPDEIIVVDHGSTDDGPAIVERLADAHPIRLIQRGSFGQAAAHITGVEHAHGDLIAFLDQDDLWYPNHLAELVKPFEERRSVRLGCVYSNVDEIDQSGMMVCRNVFGGLQIPRPEGNIVADILVNTYLVPSACMISKGCFRAARRSREQLTGSDDEDLLFRLLLTDYDTVYLHSALTAWRVRSDRIPYSLSMRVGRAAQTRKPNPRSPNAS